MTLTPQMVTIDCVAPYSLSEFWSTALSYTVTSDVGEGAYLILAPSGGGPGLRLGLQRVPEGRTGKNRVHVDYSTDQVLEDEVKRLEELGARRLELQQVPSGFTWQVMADPEGNVFCVSQG